MYSARHCPQAASSLCGVGVSRSFSDGEVMAHPPYGSAQRNVSDLPYTASPLSCVAFFVKEQGQGQIERAKRKGGRFAFCVNLP